MAALQTQSWQAAYRGMLPDTFLDAEVPGLLRERWSYWPGGDWRVETVWSAQFLLGFVSVDLAHAGGAYVDNLHVAPAAQGQGIGRVLMQNAAAHALPVGVLWLTVIDKNAGARAFYTGLGGLEGPAATELLYGQEVTTHKMIWTEATLAALAGPDASGAAARVRATQQR
ncbi:MAG: GNAT family N-acetyltransferase [Pseudomonadota bacterium]